MPLTATSFGLKATRFFFILSMLVACAVAHAQYPGRINKNTDTTPTLRATGVFEWTGDLDKPKAGRLIPLTVWDGQQYQPGGLYLAQPAPLTVLTGTIYELELAGTPKGLFNVNGAQNLSGSWIAIGSVKPEMVVKAKAKPPMSKHPPQVVKDADSDKPTLHRKDGSESTDSGMSGSASTAGASTADSDRPTLHRKDTSDNSSASASSTTSNGTQAGSGSGSSTSASDPDKPTLHKRDASDSGSGSGSGDSSDSASASSGDSDRPTLHKKDSASDTENAPSVDPDRPTLHKHQDTAANAGGPVSFPANPDPDRPKLRYGKQQTLEGSVEPSKLEGLPMDMNQMTAISDVKTRELHPFTYSWADPEDAAKMKAGMEDLAQKAIAAGFAPAPKPANVTKTSTKASTTRRKTAPPPAPPPLEDEKFSVFELSYNGGATLVLTAKSTGDNGEAKYVTLIAQPDFYGVPHPFFQQLTSDKALDISPRMHLVDAADTDGDGRAELIFELRGKTGRAFGIYRVVSGRAYEAFNTGPLP